MSYSDFIDELKSSLSQRKNIPQDIVFTNSTKNNGVIIRSVCIRKKNSPIAPSIGLDYFYDEYENGRDIDDIAESIAEIYLSQPAFDKKDYSINWQNVKDNIFFQLVNYDANKEMLKNCPHLKLFDLALTFGIDTAYLEIDGHITINNDILSMLSVTEKELVKTAVKNTPRLKPLYFSKLTQALVNMFNATTEEEFEKYDIPLWLCTNQAKTNGAAAVLYDELAEFTSWTNQTDFYVIPSSIHETLLLGFSDNPDIEALKDIVKQVNSSSYVSETEFLADSIYTLSELKDRYHQILNEFDIGSTEYPDNSSEPHQQTSHQEKLC